VVLSVEEIERLPSTSRILFRACAGNTGPEWRAPTGKTVRATHGLTSCSAWTGVPLSVLLCEAGVQQDATWLVVEGADASGNERSIPMAKAMDDVLVASGQNGEALPGERLSLAAHRSGLGGQCQHEVAASHHARGPTLHDAYGKHEARRPHAGRDGATAWVSHGSEVGDHLPLRRPAAPGAGVLRDQGVSVVGSRARPPGRGLDGWREGLAGRSPPGTDPPLRSHALPARLAMGRARGRPPVGCTDETGDVQPTRAALVKVRGLNSVYYNNAIQSWKVAADGSVHNVHI